jgi:hypothetical protein
MCSLQAVLRMALSRFLSTRCLSVLLAAVWMNPAAAQPLGKLALTARILLTTEIGASMQPLVVAPTSDGAIVVAGGIDATRQGWATAIDAEGKVRWTYYRDLEEKPDYPLGVHPEYRGVVAMPDGSVFLCGTMPPARLGQHRALLTHIDSGGRLIAEQLISSRDGRSIGVHGCAAWQGGIILKGADYGFDGSYWLLALDAAGKPRWEKQIKPLAGGPNAGATFPGSVLLPFEDKLIFSATDNQKTELISIRRDGEILGRRVLDGRFLLARSPATDSSLTALGWFGSFKAPRVVLTLDAGFNELHKAQSAPSYFAAGFVYRLPDESFVEFGGISPSPGQPRYTGGIVHVDRELRKEEVLQIEESGFEDGGHIFAAAPTAARGEFAFATVFHATPDGPNSRVRPTSGFIRGAVLRLVRLVN